MEVYVAGREKDEVLTLMNELNKLGVQGRDAAYLASVTLPCPSDPTAQDCFVRDLRFMVPPERREAAARLIGLQAW